MKSPKRVCPGCILMMLICSLSAYPAEFTEPNQVCVWGIPATDLAIQPDSVPVHAVLTIRNVIPIRSEHQPVLDVHLLKDPAPGLVTDKPVQENSPFDGFGPELGTFDASAMTGQDITIDLSGIEDPQSAIRTIFAGSFTQTFANQQTVSYSSAMLDLLNCAGSGDSFGFGLDCRAVAFSGMIFEMTTQSRINPAGQQTYTCSVGNVNGPQFEPVADFAVICGQPVSFTVRANDPDGDPLVYSAQDLPTGAEWASQTFSWIPSSDQLGPWPLSFTVSDGTLTDSMTVTITVREQNQPPVIVCDPEVTMNENQILTFPVSASDPDGDPVTVTAQNSPAGASFDGSALTWQPGYEQAGTYTVTFIASDGQLTDNQTVILTVMNVNRAPALNSIPDAVIYENQLFTRSVSASDPDGDPVTITAQNLPAGASFDGSVLAWTPAAGSMGTCSVTFVASDGSATDSRTMTLTVRDVNRPPVLNIPQELTITEKDYLQIAVSANDPDGDPVTVTAQNLPEGASFDGTQMTWRTFFGDYGTYSITFTASDGMNQAAATLTLTVLPAKPQGWYK